jgi:hypothetical protein
MPVVTSVLSLSQVNPAIDDCTTVWHAIAKHIISTQQHIVGSCNEV